MSFAGSGGRLRCCCLQKPPAGDGRGLANMTYEYVVGLRAVSVGTAGLKVDIIESYESESFVV
jgi:hypothetical protein